MNVLKFRKNLKKKSFYLKIASFFYYLKNELVNTMKQMLFPNELKCKKNRINFNLPLLILYKNISCISYKIKIFI